MCDIIERIESFGVDHEQMAQQSISLVVLGVVEDEGKKRANADDE